MLPLEHIESIMDELTPQEQAVAKYILDSPNSIIGNTLTKIAKSSGSSNSSLIRLCQKMGYQGFSEFRFAVTRELMQSSSDENQEETADPIEATIDIYTRYMKQIPQFITIEDTDEIARAVSSANRLCIWGINRTALIAEHLSMRLLRMGIPSMYTNDAMAMDNTADLLKEGDVCILFSLKGRGAKTYKTILEDLYKKDVCTILVTMTPKINLSKFAKHTVVLPCITKEIRNSFYEDQMIGHMYVELLLERIAAID